LSQLSIWAGRYPVAIRKEEYIGTPNPHALLDWGSENHVVRNFFDRMMQELEKKLPRKPNEFDVVVVFRPKTE
jgi:RNase P protein component